MVRIRKNILIILSLLSLVLLLIAYILDIVNKTNSISIPIILISIGTSIIATIVFAWLYESKIEDILIKKNSELYEELTPIKSYAASDSPIKEFNDYYNNILKNTMNIKYKGDKALYFAFRLLEFIPNRNPRMSIELILPNPKNEKLFFYRAQNLLESRKYKGKGIEEITKILKKEFFSSIIAIFDLHDYYDFHVYFIDEISFLRYEILDSILITSALTMQQNGYYAPTIVYSKSSWFYSTFLTNFNQLKDFASGNLNFSNKDFSYERILSLAKECNVNSSLEEFRKIFVEYCKKAK